MLESYKAVPLSKNNCNSLLILWGNLLYFILFLEIERSFITDLVYDIVFDTGEFQGPALVAILEGVSLSREEVSSLQFLPPWRLRGNTLNYGLGLLSCYFLCDLLSIVSGGYFYIFDPRGLVLATPSTCSPSAKMFSLTGNFAGIIYLSVSSLVRMENGLP